MGDGMSFDFAKSSLSEFKKTPLFERQVITPIVPITEINGYYLGVARSILSSPADIIAEANLLDYSLVPTAPFSSPGGFYSKITNSDTSIAEFSSTYSRYTRTDGSIVNDGGHQQLDFLGQTLPPLDLLVNTNQVFKPLPPFSIGSSHRYALWAQHVRLDTVPKTQDFIPHQYYTAGKCKFLTKPQTHCFIVEGGLNRGDLPPDFPGGPPNYSWSLKPTMNFVRFDDPAPAHFVELTIPNSAGQTFGGVQFAVFDETPAQWMARTGIAISGL